MAQNPSWNTWMREGKGIGGLSGWGIVTYLGVGTLALDPTWNTWAL